MESNEPSPAATQPPNGSKPLTRLGAFLRERYMTVDPRWLGIFRVAFGLLLVSELVNRWRYARLFFSNDGVLPNHFSLFAPMGDDLFSIYHVFSSVEEVHVAFALTLIVFLLFTVGYKTKLFHILSAICITSLHSRNLFMENGGSVVTHSLAIWTLFLPLGRAFSVDALLRSMRREKETTPEALNERATVGVEPYVSIVVFGLILQWSCIYFFNTVHKTGVGWRNGSAIHYFLYQDRIVTWVGVWAREHVPFAITKLMTRSTLFVEGTLSALLLIPFAYKQLRRVALLLALLLHGNIALLSRLGPFSYVMVIFFLMLLGQEELDFLGRWFGRPARAVKVVFDEDCGICLLLCRILKRLDPYRRLEFIGNSQTDRLPAGVTPEMTERSVVAVDAKGRLFTEERAVARIGQAIPFGVLAVGVLWLPGFAQLGRFLYRKVADNRVAISAWLGLGACGLPRPQEAEELPRRRRPRKPSLFDELRGAGHVVHETLAILLMIVLATEVIKSNPFISRRASVKRPEWMTEFIGYTRMLEGWGMFAPEPPYEDGRLVVDGRTADGRKLDPFTGEEPVFDPESPKGWGHDQLWCDYNNHIRWPHNQGRRQFLRNYLQNQHEYSGKPQDRLVAFDVWWISDKSPAPGQKHGVPLPPSKLLSFGIVRDSGAEPWLAKTNKSGPRPKARPDRPTKPATNPQSGATP